MRRWFITVLSLFVGAQVFVLAQAGPFTATLMEELGTPPTAPPPTHFQTPKAVPTFGAGFLDIADRETSRQFFNLVFQASEGVPMKWSGSYATGEPGTNSTEYLEAVQRRVNYYRAMAGLPANITFNAEYTRKAQAAALMMGGNNQLDHFPPPSWRYYSADGAEAARNSNLSLGSAGPQAVTGQVRDNGANNAAVGHRRWIFYPQTQVMGSGSVPHVGPSNSASVLWVFDTHTSDPRPATRDSFVAWPPPGYVPSQVTYARWSFSYPPADFSAATVMMTSNSVPIGVTPEAVANGFGENTIVWIPAGANTSSLPSFPRPAADTVYGVTIANVQVGGQPRSFSYDVIVFDPAVPGAGYNPPMLTGPAEPLAGITNLYSFTAVSNAHGYEWRQARLTNGTFFDGAETGLANFTASASTNLYNVVDSGVKASGANSFHLAHVEPTEQTLTLDRVFLVASNSTIQFHSRLGYATSVQHAKVQVSTDDGSSWQDVYAQSGSEGEGETTFLARTASLAPFAGRTLRLRLTYQLDPGTYYSQSSAGVGWYIDNLSVSNAQPVLSSTIAAANTNRTFDFAPAATGFYLLEVRPILFGDYPGEWGAGLAVNVVSNPAVALRITGITRVSGSTWHIDFTLLNGTPAGFELWSAPEVPAEFTRETGAAIETLQPGTRYRAVVTSSSSQRFFQVRSF